MANQQITHERLLVQLHYEPLTGAVAWRVRSRGRRERVGALKQDGRVRVFIEGARYQLGRLCWFYAYGEWPVGFIDHVNGDPSDNRLTNLRDVSRDINAQNRRKVQRHSTVGVMGVQRNRSGSFRASMSFQGKSLRVGTFDTAEAAHAFYLELKRRLHDGCTI